MTWKLTDRSFSMFRGISRETERDLYVEGVTDVGLLLRYLTRHGSNALLGKIEPQIRLFQYARRLGMADLIVNMLPVGTRTRLISDRFEKTLFFDIETDGMGAHASITLIAAIMNGNERVFVRGIDLPEFLELWQHAEVVVSFNGKRFDVPVLMREFVLSRIPAHVDLMDECRVYGLRGGLKDIERRIGFRRMESNCRNGLDAVELWTEFCRGRDPNVLEELKTYNLEDARSLVALYRFLLPLANEGLFDL